MDKVLVDLFVPALEQTYDIFVPLQSPMHEVVELMKKAVVDMSDGRFVANETTSLCNREDGTIININLSVYELGIRNGSRLMLI